MNHLGKLKAYARTRNTRNHQGRDAALAFFGAGALEEIEGILDNVSPDKQVRDTLAWSLCAYVRDRAGTSGYSGEGSPAQIRHHVETISRASQALQAALAIDDAAAETVALLLESRGVDVEGLKEQIVVVIAELELIKTDPGGGRPRNDPEFSLLMDRVADIFETETHQRATLTDNRSKGVVAGKFFRMAELVDAAAASAVGRDPMKNGPLGDLLKNLLKQRVKPVAIHP